MDGSPAETSPASAYRPLNDAERALLVTAVERHGFRSVVEWSSTLKTLVPALATSDRVDETLVREIDSAVRDPVARHAIFAWFEFVNALVGCTSAESATICGDLGAATMDDDVCRMITRKHRPWLTTYEKDA